MNLFDINLNNTYKATLINNEVNVIIDGEFYTYDYNKDFKLKRSESDGMTMVVKFFTFSYSDKSLTDIIDEGLRNTILIANNELCLIKQTSSTVDDIIDFIIQNKQKLLKEKVTDQDEEYYMDLFESINESKDEIRNYGFTYHLGNLSHPAYFGPDEFFDVAVDEEYTRVGEAKTILLDKISEKTSHLNELNNTYKLFKKKFIEYLL